MSVVPKLPLCLTEPTVTEGNFPRPAIFDCARNDFTKDKRSLLNVYDSLYSVLTWGYLYSGGSLVEYINFYSFHPFPLSISAIIPPPISRL